MHSVMAKETTGRFSSSLYIPFFSPGIWYGKIAAELWLWHLPGMLDFPGDLIENSFALFSCPVNGLNHYTAFYFFSLHFCLSYLVSTMYILFWLYPIIIKTMLTSPVDEINYYYSLLLLLFIIQILLFENKSRALAANYWAGGHGKAVNSARDINFFIFQTLF